MLSYKNLDTPVEPQEIAASTDAPGYVKKVLITNKVTTHFFTTPITPLAPTLSTSSTAVSRLNLDTPVKPQEIAASPDAPSYVKKAM